MFTSKELFERRRARSRTKLRKVANGQPRLTVHRSSRHIYAQVIDDEAGNTMVAASTLDVDFKNASTATANVAAAAVVGKLVAERAKAKGHRRCGIRSRWVYFPWSRKSVGRCRA